jgi:hypothetical protein
VSHNIVNGAIAENVIKAIIAEVVDAERVSPTKWKSINICRIPAMTWYSKINILKRTNVLKKIDELYESMNKANESWLSSRRLSIYAETGRTIKKISIPETR